MPHGAGDARPHVLFVTPSFFGYEQAIAAAFAERGARVTLLDERASNASWVKALARVAPFLLALLTRRHFARALRAAALDPPDLVVVVKGEVVPRAFLRALRRTSPSCVLAFYAFDSFANSPRGATLLPEVDHAFGFDRDDAAEHAMTYKPLFFAPEFAHARRTDAARAHDLAFVGTVHSGRWAVCRRLFAAGHDSFGFFYSPARWHHALQRLLHRDVRRIPWSDVSFTKLSREQVAAVFADARAVVDVQRTGQTGLTMRTFEVLAAGAGLVTTNASIVDEPFCDPRWVHVLTGPSESWDLDAVAAFVAASSGAPPAVVAPYALGEWVQEFLDLLPAPAPVR